MKRIVLSLLLLGMLVLPGAAFAKVITIVNNTRLYIHEVYVSDTNINDWEDDILGREVLSPGESVQLNIRGNFRGWDLKAVDENGDSMEWTNLNFNNYSRVTLNSDGTAGFR